MKLKVIDVSFSTNEKLDSDVFWNNSKNYPCIGKYIDKNHSEFEVLFFERNRGIVISTNINCTHNIGLYLSSWCMNVFIPIINRETNITLKIKA